MAEVDEMDLDDTSQGNEPLEDFNSEQPGTGEQPNEQLDSADELESDEQDEFSEDTDNQEPNAKKKHKSTWVANLRKTNRENRKRIKDLEAKLQKVEGGTSSVQPAGSEPTPEDYYDNPKEYGVAYKAWFARKQAEKAEQDKQAQKAKEVETAWSMAVTRHTENKSKLARPDMEEKETLVSEFLDPAQQGMIIQGASDSARLIHYLGSNIDMLDSLSQISDPVTFAFTVGRLEAGIMKSSKQPTPARKPPEKSVRGGGASLVTSDKKLEMLRAKASKTGDFTEVIRYKRSLRSRK